MLFYSGVDSTTRARDVADVLSEPNLEERIVGCKPVSETMAVLQLKLHQAKVFPSLQDCLANSEEDCESFLDDEEDSAYEKLTAEFFFLRRDFNAHVGTDTVKWNDLIGKYDSTTSTIAA
ncbi:unnamed protein product [Soboliphyme baturini]|uniref:TMV resistance protein N-like n=1 Tax=Soboliphyme baturini TaxID=241478 RepID=A0A183IRR0_9BILA|nr:unnamed protein product [Soboliphyme baturini]